MSDDDKNKPEKEAAKAFKAGWEQRARDGFVSPELKQAIIENYGIHPDRVQEFVEAQQAHQSKRGEKPDPENYKTPKIVPFKKPDDGPKNDGGPA